MIEAKIVDLDTLAPESSEAKVMGITQNVLDRICEEKLTRRDAYAVAMNIIANTANEIDDPEIFIGVAQDLVTMLTGALSAVAKQKAKENNELLN